MSQDITSLVSSMAHRLARIDGRHEDHQRLTNSDCSFDDPFDGFVSERCQQHMPKLETTIIREGLMSCMKVDTTVDSLSETSWEKCRLLLFSTNDVARLQIFIPGKSKKPKYELSSSSIKEVRATTILEMPDQEHTFVIKAEDNREYIIQAKGEQDMSAWISSLISSMNSKTKPSVDPQDEEDTHPMKFPKYPWFHGKLARSEAADLVVKDKFFGHGRFLIRESGTRIGEYVVTFNFEGRAKHLRINISEEGECRVQHFWFKTILDMIEYFKVNSIPLESEGSPLVLTEFIPKDPFA